MCKTCDKNTSNKKKLKFNCLIKLKEFSRIVLEKGLFVSMKGHVCLIKGNLANPVGHLDIKLSNSPHQEVFLIVLIQIKKKNSKRAPFNNLWMKGLIDKMFAIAERFIISNSDSNQFEFS